MKLPTTNHKLRTSGGFSLIELMVVIGIFALLSGVIFSNYGKFNVKASLDNLTHEVALVIRQAQVYGISVAQKGQMGYGVYFSTEALANQTVFVLFNDRHGALQGSASDKMYNDQSLSCDGNPPNDECLEKISIQSGDKVSELCGFGQSEDTCENLTDLSIVFTRPNPEASLIAKTCYSDNASNFSHVRIILLSPSGDKKSVIVWTTGQVDVENEIPSFTVVQSCP